MHKKYCVLVPVYYYLLYIFNMAQNSYHYSAMHAQYAWPHISYPILLLYFMLYPHVHTSTTAVLAISPNMDKFFWRVPAGTKAGASSPSNIIPENGNLVLNLTSSMPAAKRPVGRPCSVGKEAVEITRDFSSTAAEEWYQARVWWRCYFHWEKVRFHKTSLI